MNEQDTYPPPTAPELTTDTTGFEFPMRQTELPKLSSHVSISINKLTLEKREEN